MLPGCPDKTFQILYKSGKGFRIPGGILLLLVIVTKLDKEEIPLADPGLYVPQSALPNKAFGAAAVFRVILHPAVLFEKKTEYLADAGLGVSGIVIGLHGGIPRPKDCTHMLFLFSYLHDLL